MMGLRLYSNRAEIQDIFLQQCKISLLNIEERKGKIQIFIFQEYETNAIGFLVVQ